MGIRRQQHLICPPVPRPGVFNQVGGREVCSKDAIESRREDNVKGIGIHGSLCRLGAFIQDPPSTKGTFQSSAS